MPPSTVAFTAPSSSSAAAALRADSACPGAAAGGTEARPGPRRPYQAPEVENLALVLDTAFLGFDPFRVS